VSRCRAQKCESRSRAQNGSLHTIGARRIALLGSRCGPTPSHVQIVKVTVRIIETETTVANDDTTVEGAMAGFVEPFWSTVPGSWGLTASVAVVLAERSTEIRERDIVPAIQTEGLVIS